MPKNPKSSRRTRRRMKYAPPPLGHQVLDLIRQAIGERCDKAKTLNEYRAALESLLEDSELWAGLENLRLAMKQLKRDCF